MNTLVLVLLLFAGYYGAYHTYGRFLARKIFKIDPEAEVPSKALRDDVDFAPANRFVLFGHHFTTIAGTGPIVGPALALIWGWLPAVLWVFFGSIMMGAVHDFGALVISMRNRGRTIGDLAGEILNPRARILFMLIIFFAIWIVIAIFAMLIAQLFQKFPVSIIPVWSQIPIALVLGHLVYKKNMDHRILGLVAVGLMYGTMVLGQYYPVTIPDPQFSILGFSITPLIIWMALLFIYIYIASTLPVQVLLQPRDYINAFQLLIAMGLLTLGIILARPDLSAPALNTTVADAPPIWPFLFVIIACGAISGFHCLASSGTTSKQIASEKDALFVGYGSMLIEGVLAVLVIGAIAGGLGMGLKQADGSILTGVAAYGKQYASWKAANGSVLAPFVIGGTNMIAETGLPVKFIETLLSVFLVSFAATTLDSATRIQRYVIAELASTVKIKALGGRHAATSVAVLSAAALAFSSSDGSGAKKLWPLFGTVNQLLGGLALLVLTVYLIRKEIRAIFTAAPMVFMIILTGSALCMKLHEFYTAKEGINWLLFSVGGIILALEVWMIVESVIVVKSLRAEKARK
ncbi:MAG: carbon starvation protein A [Planctomycetes bacterium]|nr:carbon starvation protein A [Planctomycetota bacterium]